MNLIYKATNIENGKSYIGITTKSLLMRIDGHKNNSNRENAPFSRAIRKYGIDGFRWDVIRVCFDVDEMKRLECFYIKEYGTHASTGNGYNATLGGDGVSGYVFTEEAKRKISKAGRGRVKSYETRMKLRAANLGKKPSYDPTGIPKTESAKKNMRANHVGFTGKKWSDSHREKITSKQSDLKKIGGFKNQKLKPSDYNAVLKLRNDGWSFSKIGEAFGCSASAIFYFVKRMAE